MENPVTMRKIPIPFLKKIPRQYIFCFFSTLLWGLIAHGMALFNKYAIYEDVSQLFGVGATYQSGRWMLDILHRLEVFFLGGSYSLPLINGLATIIYISLIACMIANLLSVKKILPSISLGGILVTTPVLTGTFGYMFTAPHYAFGLMLGVCGVVLICKKRKWYTCLVGVLLIACAVGIYQATIATVLFLLLTWFIHQTYTEKWNIGKCLLRICYLLVTFLAALLFYFAINKLYLRLNNGVLTSYQGIDTAGKLPLVTYIKRAILAYKLFLLPDQSVSAFMYRNGMIWIYRIAQLLAIGLSIVLLVKSGKEKLLKSITLLLAMVLLPLALNFIYVMCESEQVHSLMVYNHVMLFVYLLWLSGTLLSNLRRSKSCCVTICLVVILLSGLYVRYDNICYMKAEFVQEQTINYYNTLITRIKSTTGYRDEMAVNFINFNDQEDATLTVNSGFDSVNIIPYYDTEDMVNSFANRSFIRYWCGFNPVYDYTDYSGDPYVQEMPCYPDDGSIAIINDTVIVKFTP